ncbi:hypothetical protein KIN20_025152 [Parelaphostrongylus tenuis]|uniref:Uncharacterized protein n=1 Tax=Parelaphostrongylus tenuis TaxID=148309 RepID=A0AAD5MUP6_PARTN|nr:hypothetical protein KIN20_025152 [Parelaphostrongylus tenuis]
MVVMRFKLGDVHEIDFHFESTLNKVSCLYHEQHTVPGELGKLPHCIIFGSTITALCTAVRGGQLEMCKLSDNTGITAIPPEHRSISGTLTTTNIVMANWSREVWQNVVNRAVRMLASGPFGSHFLFSICNCQLRCEFTFEIL